MSIGMMKTLVMAASASAMLLVCLAGCNTAPTLEQQIDALYDRMPQEERIAQLKSPEKDPEKDPERDPETGLPSL